MLLETSLIIVTKLTDVEDRVKDIILAVDNGLLKPLKGNTESVKLPTFLKNTLKKSKCFLFLIHK